MFILLFPLGRPITACDRHCYCYPRQAPATSSLQVECAIHRKRDALVYGGVIHVDMLIERYWRRRRLMLSPQSRSMKSKQSLPGGEVPNNIQGIPQLSHAHCQIRGLRQGRRSGATSRGR